VSGYDQLDIVLAGAEDDIVRQIQSEILSKPCGDLRDPACTWFAAARRCQLEAERIIPRWLAAGATDAADLGAKTFEAKVTETVEPILRDLAEKAARTSFSDWRTQQIRLVTTLGAFFFLVVGGLTDRLAAHSFHLPAEVAEYVANGNRLVWLNNCPGEQLSTQGGRTKCSIAFWMEPPSRPIENGPLADSAVIAEILPAWMQRIVVGTLGLGALALIVCPWLPRCSVRLPLFARVMSVLAGVALGGWLWSVISPWF